jgi:excisionase family DNA binding protein
MPQSSRAPLERAEHQFDSLATTEDVAKLARVSKRTVQIWVHERRIPHLKLGRLLRFRLADVQRALNRHTIQEVK